MTTAQIDFNAPLEKLLKEQAEESECLSILHNLSYDKYNFRSNALDIPVIVLSCLLGFTTGLDFQYDRMNIILGVGSVFVGLLKSIQSFFQLAQRATQHRMGSLSYSAISKKIQIELRLKRDQRIPAKEMVNFIKTDMANLADILPQIDNDIIQLFNSKYGEYTTKKPAIVNGLTDVVVCEDGTYRIVNNVVDTGMMM
jgi:hypothetical protein